MDARLPSKILAVDLPAKRLTALRGTLRRLRLGMDAAQDTLDALSLMMDNSYALVVLHHSPSDRSAKEARAQLERMRPGTPVLVLDRENGSRRRLADAMLAALDRNS